MKVKVLGPRSVLHGKKLRLPGAIFDLEEAEAKRLMSKSIVGPVGKKQQSEPDKQKKKG